MSNEEANEVWTIVVGGGSGTRYGAAKQFDQLGDRRVIDWAVRASAAASTGVVVVVPTAAFDHEQGRPGVTAVVVGGATRSQSVRAGLAAVPESADIVLVHDAARPLASSELFARCIAAVARGGDAVVPTIPVSDSLRRTDGGPVDRSNLVAVQTPQGFSAAMLRRAHESEPEASDDASLVDALGGNVVLVDGEVTNIKLTNPSDITVANALLQRP